MKHGTATAIRKPAPRLALAWAALALVAGLLLAGCAPAPMRSGDNVVWHASPNFDERRPNLVILHHTSDDTVGQALDTLTTPERKVSAHYLISRDGTVFQLVDERHRAWHAGKSYWGGHGDINSTSIGIELDNNGSEPYPEPLLLALFNLLEDLKARYKLSAANFVGHGDVAPGRKDDPNGLFPWKRLAERGFGLWCEPPYPPAPDNFDVTTGLMALGYNLANPAAALQAFRTHFVREGGWLGSEYAQTAGALNCLLQQKTLLLQNGAPPP